MKILLRFGVLSAALFFASCTKEDDLDRKGELNTARPAAIGGTILSGYQDGALYVKGQENSIASLFFEQLSNYEGGEFSLPLISSETEEGVGINLNTFQNYFRKRSWLALTTSNGETSLGPVFTNYENDPSDITALSSSLNGQYQCVPFAYTESFLDADFGLSYEDGNPNPFFHRFSQNPGVLSPLDELSSYDPTFSLMWLGMDDIYNYAIAGGDTTEIPSAADFKANMKLILDEIVSTNGQGVLLNILSIEDLPFFTLVDYDAPDIDAANAELLTNLNGLEGYNHITFEEGHNPFVIFDDNHPTGRRQLVFGEMVLFSLPLNLVQENLLGIGNPMPNRYVLTLEQISKIKSATIAYNNVIRELAEEYSLAHCDINSYFKQVDAGVQWNAQNFSLTFASGGFISLDGLNPTQKGSELITNQVIEAVNRQYKSNIPNVNCKSCDGVLFP
jgi:hypothetical protein